MQEFLEQNGYKLYDTKQEFVGQHSWVTLSYQKRVDTKEDWKDSELCNCNDKLFLNITETVAMGTTKYTIKLVHENGYCEWCELSIYNLIDGEIESNLVKYEHKLKKMWDIFCE